MCISRMSVLLLLLPLLLLLLLLNHLQPRKYFRHRCQHLAELAIHLCHLLADVHDLLADLPD